MLEQNNVLIGENARGKSSLLDALTVIVAGTRSTILSVISFPPGDIKKDASITRILP